METGGTGRRAMNTGYNFGIASEFQEKYPTKQDKEEALKKMTNDEIDELINACPNIYAKICYSSFKKK